MNKANNTDSVVSQNINTIQFGAKVFNNSKMKKYFSTDVYSSLKKTIEEGKPLDINLANEIAQGMKQWALENGCTHYCHWFQPMTGITAEKHDSFITKKISEDGNVLMEFRGKELIKGEGDGSSFPSGGLRATFEARGYTAWDPTSYAFIKDTTLYIPTVFCSYDGSSLDKKTPLLKSMEALNIQTKRLLKLFGKNVKKVTSSVGPEQEYFLIDKELFKKRKDLIFCNRTLFGAKAPKGQELEDHYYGQIKPRVAEFMKDLDKELWSYGILSKTKHNEVAPCQHEMAPIFTTTNLSADQNQLTMEVMKNVAQKHGMVCILHEKPFAGVNGSGKHNNWSISTDEGENLLEPGNTPEENAQFLLILTAIIKAVDEHQDLLRLSVASRGNDLRLGGNEAPPAIISMFLGDELTSILESIMNGTTYDKKAKQEIKLGIDTLPTFPKDNTDRNRTSPFAFTGNKFEFRSLGSSASISCPNVMINTIVADVFKEFCDELEGAKDFTASLNALIKKTLIKHKRIIFNGDGYSAEWVEEAKKRGLLNLPSTTDALPYYIKDENIALFERHGIYNATEVHARYEIQMEEYAKLVNIEVNTMLDMAEKEIIPACIEYASDMARNFSDFSIIYRNHFGDTADNIPATIAKNIGDLLDKANTMLKALQIGKVEARKISDMTERAKYYTKEVIPVMDELRNACDELEKKVPSKYWPFPTYADILFQV
ncbi:MAG: glutamine synthetase III [Treponemataceae bacterium]|nr:glutamine synthetase III [Spirochaetales bacterium]MDY6030240.1 glutamine synthetase III [Treponemataceae bacterium]